VHKLSHAELLQKKLNAKSKNHELAKAEMQEKMEQLRQGHLPEEYREIVHKERKFTAK